MCSVSRSGVNTKLNSIVLYYGLWCCRNARSLSCCYKDVVIVGWCTSGKAESCINDLHGAAAFICELSAKCVEARGSALYRPRFCGKHVQKLTIADPRITKPYRGSEWEKREAQRTSNKPSANEKNPKLLSLTWLRSSSSCLDW
jgi:hypothetical protein